MAGHDPEVWGIGRLEEPRPDGSGIIVQGGLIAGRRGPGWTRDKYHVWTTSVKLSEFGD